MTRTQADQSKSSLRDGFKKIAGIVASFDQSLAHDLDQLGELLYLDVGTGLSQLREGLPRILRKAQPSEKFPDYIQFFETCQLPGGKPLSTDSIHKLTGLASSLPSGIEAEQSNAEQNFERKYWNDPDSFWILLSQPRDLSTTSIIRYISESIDEQDYLNPIRRRIALSILFEKVQSQSRQLQANGNILRRGQTFKGVTNDVLLDSLWDKSDLSAKKKRTQFVRNVRAGGKWAGFEPGVLIGLADHQAWKTWHRLNDEEFKAMAEYVSSLPAHKRWKKLSPLTLKLKSTFLGCLTGAAGVAAHSGFEKRKRAGDNIDSQDQNPSKQKRRAKTNSSNTHEHGQDTASPRGHSQPPTPVANPYIASDMAPSLQVLVEAATTTSPISNGYSAPLLHPSFTNGMNNFDIAAGHTPYLNVINDFDISANPCGAPQPPSFGETIFMDGMNELNNRTDSRSVPPLSSLDASFTDGLNDFDISASGHAGPHPLLSDILVHTGSDFDTPHEDIVDRSSFQHNINNFDISADHEDVSSAMANAQLLPISNSQFQPLLEA